MDDIYSELPKTPLRACLATMRRPTLFVRAVGTDTGNLYARPEERSHLGGRHTTLTPSAKSVSVSRHPRSRTGARPRYQRGPTNRVG